MANKTVKVKPSKTSSTIGFVVGLAFIILGFVVVIPTFGPFGILWTFAAGAITVINGKNAFTEEGVAAYEIRVNEEETGTEDIETKLRKLQSLYDRSVITKDEYDAKRRDILDQF